MNDLLHLVAKGWYRLYYGTVLLTSVLLAGACLAVRFVPSLQHYQTGFGLTEVTLVLCGAVIFYCVAVYPFIVKYSAPMAMFGASMLYVLVALEGLFATNPSPGTWIYVIGWFINVFFTGIYGTPMLLGTVLLASIYVLFDSQFKPGDITAQSWVMLGGGMAVAAISFWFWHKKSIDPVDRQLTQLSGMLSSNQQQSAILIQSIADGVIVTDTEGKIGLINPAAAVMTEWSVEEASSIDVNQVIKLTKEGGEEIPAEENPFTTVLRTKKRINATFQLTGRRGRKQLVSLVIAPIAVPGGGVGGAVAVMHDVSEARAAEQQRGEFISTASHEMRTPVAAIEGYLALALNEKVSTIDSRARGYLEKAHSSTQHLGQLFQDLLTSAKAEDGRLTSHPTVVEMGSFTEQLVEDLRFSAQKKGLATEFIVGSNESIDATSDSESAAKKVIKPLYYILADPDRLREVITNIFDNAVKYTDQGKLSMGLTGNNEVVQFYIRDTGPGIPAEDIPHLFQKFYRVDNSATRTIGGTGLGLFICRKIIELYHGRIWVESTLGKGSAFFINLPRVDTQKAQTLQKQAAAAPPPAPVTPAKV
jgi:PAS domain S-box-containing protein